MEFVNVIGKLCRALRLEWVAAASLALALPGAASATITTQTSLSATTQSNNGITEAVLTIGVTGSDSQTVSGVVAIYDYNSSTSKYVVQSGVSLSSGAATATLGLTPGSHQLLVKYLGDSTHASSSSSAISVTGTDYGAFNFTTAIDTPSLTVTAGQSNETLSTAVPIVVSVTPINASVLSGPQTVTLSCAGLPDQATCSFTSSNTQITVGSTTALSYSLDIQTQSASSALRPLPMGRESRPIAWAFLLPGALALAGLGFGARRRKCLRRFSLLALLALVAMLGTTACNPRYSYLNHGPETNTGTPTGTYTVTVDAQTNYNGTAITHKYSTIVLTVN